MSLEKQFNLAENNPDQGGGILYCMRYEREHIEEHHAQVIAALKAMGISFREEGESGIAAESQDDLDPEQQRRRFALLEELSVINEAREYKEAGLDGVKSVSELSNRLVVTFHGLLRSRKLANAYDFVTVFLPMIISDIRLADKQNKVLSSEDRAALDKLSAFVVSKERFLNSPGGFTVLGG